MNMAYISVSLEGMIFPLCAALLGFLFSYSNIQQDLIFIHIPVFIQTFGDM